LISDFDSGGQGWLHEVTLERMSPYDIAAVLRIEHISFPSAWSAESYLRELRNPTSYYLVARWRGDIVGYAGMWVIPEEAHVSTIAVHPEVRRGGLGEAMMRHLIGVARARGATRMTLEVREANEAAQSLYAKLGFTVQETIPRYYGDTGENALLMLLDLAACGGAADEQHGSPGRG
jgi:ribosomal-protein-alanine N-acetyltransferase